MAKIRINWPLVTVIVVAFVMVVLVASALRKWQLNRMGLKARQAGLTAWQQQNWEDAAKNLSAYLSVNPSDVDILRKYAFAQLNIRPLGQNNLQQAVAAYRSILRIDKTSETTAQNLINLYLRLNVPTEAQLIAERCLQAADNPRIRVLLATAMAKQGKFEEAAAQMQAVISESPSLIIAYDTLAQLKEQHHEKLPALADPEYWLNKAVETNPSSAVALIARAAFYLRKNDTSSALADLKEAERLDHSDPKVCLQLALAYGNAGLLDKARSYLINVQNVEPGNPALWHIWARLALAGGSKEEMLHVAQNGLKELLPSQWDFMPSACELFIYCGRNDDAADCIAKLKQKDIEPARTAFLEAMLAQNTGHYHKAIFFLQRAEQLGDTSGQIHLALADAYCRTGDYQSAALQLRTLVNEQPNLLQGHMEFARLLCRTENWPDAQQQAQAAIAIAPDNVDAGLICIEAKMHLVDNENLPADEILRDLGNQLADISQRAKDNPAVALLQFQLAMKKKDFAQAEHLLGNLQSRKNGQVEIALAEVDLLIAEGKTKHAIEKLYVIVDKFSQNALPVEQLALLLARNGDKDKCEELLQDAVQRIELCSAKCELGLLLEYFYQQWNQNNKAWLYLTSLSQQLPEDIPIKRRLLTYEQLLKNPIEAQRIVDEIKAFEGEDGWQWRYEQAKLWFADNDLKKRYPQIIALLKENIAANPADKMSLALLAHTYNRGGETQLSSSVYCRALNRWPNDADLIVSAVMQLNQAEEYQRANEILDRVAAERINNPQISRLLLQSYLRRGKLDSAEAVLGNLIIAEPNNPDLSLSSALLKIQQNKYDDALEILNRLKTREPASFQVSAAIVELGVRQKKEKEAIELCDDMVEKFGNVSAYLLRAKVYAMFGRSNEAESDFAQAIMLEPDNPDLWAAKSDFELSRGYTEQTSDSIRKAVSLMPDNTRIQQQAAGLLLSSKNPENVKLGMQILDKALSVEPQNITLRLYKARSLLSQANPQSMKQARLILERITSEQPATPQAWVMLAQIHMNSSQLGPAMDKILHGLTYSPTDKSLLILKARVEAESSPAVALPTLKILREQFPNDTDVIVELANIYMRMDAADKAVDCLEAFLPGCKENDRIRVNTVLAAALYKKGDVADAERVFVNLHESVPGDTQVFLAHVEALKYAQNWEMLDRRINDRFRCDPNNSDIFIKIAENLASTGNSQGKEIAEQLLEKILQCEPNHVTAMNTLAMILQSRGRSEQATSLYRKVIELKPDTVSAINNLAWILCEEQREYQQALELAQKGIEQSGNYADIIDTRGVIYYRLGEYHKAVDDFSRCVKISGADSPHLAGSCFHLGRAQAAIGQSSEAVDNLRKALDLNSQARVLTESEIDEAKSILSKLSEE